MARSIPTLDEALAIVRQLSPSDRAELVARIVRELAEPSLPMRRRLSPDEVRAAVTDIRSAVETLPQPRLTIGDLLEQDRQARDSALMRGAAPPA